MKPAFRLGLDAGSTTVKLLILDSQDTIIYKRYERHLSKVREKSLTLLQEGFALTGDASVSIALSGSAGLGLSEELSLPFAQEVFVTKTAVRMLLPTADVAIELGGEDAKILFLTGGSEERMNGSCAGGTGAFIDQMASLFNLTLDELDELSLRHEQIYNIASRCGVFAKSDIQPLLNQGANKADICASIYQAIVNQTIAGLAQGRDIKGTVAFLGGPLTFQYGLRDRFVKTLNLDEDHALFPENSPFFVAYGAAVLSEGAYAFSDLLRLFREGGTRLSTGPVLPPLFEDEASYASFLARHKGADVPLRDLATYEGDAYLGIDAGSTTTKLALITPEGELLYQYYASNKGEPLPVLREQLQYIAQAGGDRLRIRASAVTGYGEELIAHAFSLDYGIVETTAHFYAARHFSPDVDFILDIGGQDMKCFHLKKGIVDSILLNEACSSGCGSFIESFAIALGYRVPDFAAEGIWAQKPVDLGSRCTVFMNSSVKQAQKDGASVADISAGLAVSVVKNVLYKVIRAPRTEELGKHIVVQGGTFLNDCVLRAFEQHLGRDVVRPSIAGLMGAYGAALYARSRPKDRSSLISPQKLADFSCSARMITCKGCANACKLTVSTFPDGQFLSGNRCDVPLGRKAARDIPNAFAFKRDYLLNLPKGTGRRGRIGIPLGLNMLENLPFWSAILVEMGFDVVTSGFATRELYSLGQHTIPSDTACYPAKLMHGHVESLLQAGVTRIFYPCMTYNFKEDMGDNHYNCPLVAYYPEMLYANIENLRSAEYHMPYFAPPFEKTFLRSVSSYFHKHFGVPAKVSKAAVEKGFQAHEAFKRAVLAYGEKAIAQARAQNRHMIVLCGRPYHIDPEINHGLDTLLLSLGVCVLTEDCLPFPSKKPHVDVLNQWTYHARMYAAAQTAAEQPDMDVVQLVSFGCGLDAITTDEIKAILEQKGRIYTQIKIDEINNLGAAKIRLRSLLETIKQQKEEIA